MMKNHSKRNDNGFTLLEILIVIVLIAIFITLTVTHHSTSDHSLTVQTEVLKSHLRYAQMRAMNTDMSWGIYYHYDSGNSHNCYYLLFSNNNINEITILPGESQDRVYIGDMNITIASAGNLSTPAAQTFQIEFDSWGSPSSNPLDIPTKGSYRLLLSKPGHTPQQFIITQNTGFIN